VTPVIGVEHEHVERLVSSFDSGGRTVECKECEDSENFEGGLRLHVRKGSEEMVDIT